MKTDKLSEICRNFQYSFYPRLSIYNGRSVEDCEFRGYVNTSFLNGREQMNVRNGKFTTENISSFKDFIAYLSQVDEMIKSSKDNKLRGSLILGIERLVGENISILNLQAKRRDLRVDEYEAELLCKFPYEKLEKIREGGEIGGSNTGRRISQTHGLSGRGNDYKLKYDR